jgi:hypothetical protein
MQKTETKNYNPDTNKVKVPKTRPNNVHSTRKKKTQQKGRVSTKNLKFTIAFSIEIRKLLRHAQLIYKAQGQLCMLQHVVKVQILDFVF